MFKSNCYLSLEKPHPYLAPGNHALMIAEFEQVEMKRHKVHTIRK
ncbi:MAG: hypothetical protein ABSB25_09795 [Sedimentisphaerales bacterium]